MPSGIHKLTEPERRIMRLIRSVRENARLLREAEQRIWEKEQREQQGKGMGMEIYKLALEEIETMMGKDSTFSDDLYRVGKKLINNFEGVFPSDEFIPKKNRNYIVNLDKSDEPGSHWIAIHVCKNKNTYVYDSFGRKTKTIIKIKKGGRVYDSDNDPEQKISENNCGQRSIAWLFVLDKFGKDIAMTI